jgi:ankyrin repeat protein
MPRSIANSLFSVCLFAGFVEAQTPGKVDFRRDIRPLFQERCIGCHGPAQQMGGMRLDRRSSAMGIRSGTTIGPGNADGSRLYLKLISTKFGGRMPPTGPLSPEQISLIKAWIDQGAEWPDDLAGEKAPTTPDPRAARIMETLRSGDRQTFMRLLREDPGAVKLKGAGGSTPLMYAALYGDPASVRELLERGSDPNAANDAGATALMWAVEDFVKARLLVEHGADVNAMSIDSRTALAIALGNRGSAAVVKLLLDHGANVEAKSYQGRSMFAGAGSDEAVLRALIEHGVETARLSPALASALASNCTACVDLLIPLVPKAVLSSVLIATAGDRDARAFKVLLDHQADAKAVAPGLGFGFTSLMVAADSEAGAEDRVKNLIEHGAEINAKTADGMTALDFALRSGDPSVVEVLRKAGAKEGSASARPVLKPKPAASARVAIDRSIPLLQRSDVAFLRRSGCVSCHNNNLTAMTIAAARKQGIRVDDGVARAQVKAIALYVEGDRERYLQGVSIPGGADTTSYILLGMAAESWLPDPATDAMARYLKGRQRADGYWRTFGGRPPIESSDIQNTATAMRAIQVYMPKPDRAEYEKTVQLAADWIAKAQPLTTEDRVFQILGLVWAGGRQEAALRAAGILLAEQRSDGGWGQTPALSSDAYATGQALVALKEVGAVMPSDEVYKHGARFLMNTQMEDGSWYVRSRAIPLQPYFDAGFPYGLDQYISAAATNWATMALIPLTQTTADNRQ